MPISLLKKNGEVIQVTDSAKTISNVILHPIYNKPIRKYKNLFNVNIYLQYTNLCI